MYTIAIWAAMAVKRVKALWDEKTRLFVSGRRGLVRKIRAEVGRAGESGGSGRSGRSGGSGGSGRFGGSGGSGGQRNIIWFHVSSRWEFEVARPVIEAYRKRFPQMKILLTFYSPSGYELWKEWRTADWVFYLPVDSYCNAKRLVRAVRPAKAVFTAGELWPNYLRELRRAGTDCYMISMKLKETAPYMKWYGCMYRQALKKSFKAIMVRDDKTKAFIEGLGCSNVAVSGDTRIDRIHEIASTPWQDRIVETWLAGKKAAIAGKSHLWEDELFLSLAQKYPLDKFMIVPFQGDEEAVHRLVKTFGDKAALYSHLEYVCGSGTPQNVREDVMSKLPGYQVLIVDRPELQLKLYRYGWCALVGGAFINRPHNVMEAVVYGMPVAMGPEYHRSSQFVDLMDMGAATPVKTEEDIQAWYDKYRRNPSLVDQARDLEAHYCIRNIGVIRKILDVVAGV